MRRHDSDKPAGACLRFRAGVCGRDDLTNPGHLFRMRWGPFACRDPRPAGARQPKATQQFLDVPQFDQSFFVFDWDAVHRALGAISQRREFFVR